MRRRHRVSAALLTAALVASQATAALAYENNQAGAAPGGGAHRKINQMAGALYIKEVAKGEHAAAFKRYDFQPLLKDGTYKVIPLNDEVPEGLAAGLFRPQGTTINARMNWRDEEYDAAQATVRMKFSSWVIEGGFTADEPERFMSLRHFYNPAGDLGPAWLTDIPWGAGRVAMGANPEIDAITWATTHSDNQYTWTRGSEYLKAAFAAKDIEEAQKNYAAAWRSLGETMHLAADMTVPAHVRNDAHPGNAYAAGVVDDLRSDAYEYLTNTANLIEWGWTNRLTDTNLLGTIQDAETPEALMKAVASWVNAGFWSTDTIPFRDEDGGITTLNVGRNNTVLYTYPSLDAATTDPKTGNIMGTDPSGAPMIMAHTSWLNANGWNSYPGAVNYDTVQSQAQRLVPAAVWSAERLMELFVPLVELKVAAIETDEETKAPLITGEVAARLPAAGGYPAKADGALLNDTTQSVLLFVRLTKKDGSAQERVYLAPPTKITGGEFDLSLEDCTNADGLHDIIFPPAGAKPEFEKVEFGLGFDMGGVLVRSDYFSDEGIAGTWDVESSIDEVEIPPELMNTEGMTEEEARMYVESMKLAYGGNLEGQTFRSVAEIAAKGTNYVLTPIYDEKTKQAFAQAGVSMAMATTLKGSRMHAEVKTSYGLGSTSSVIDADVSADRRTMVGTTEMKLVMSAGMGTITVVYKGTWKAEKQD